MRRSIPATYCYLLWFVPSPPLRLPTSPLIRVVLFASSPSRWPAGRFPISERLRLRPHGPSGPLRPCPPGFAGVLSPAPPPHSPWPCPHERRFACAPRHAAGHGCSNKEERRREQETSGANGDGRHGGDGDGLRGGSLCGGDHL